ncbi:MAG: peptidylprolyl isomerase [Alphaproteobacteria bacterium]|nr:peptidylprolyl isomerase [Alphaproteobacteria bacterium]
MVAASPAEAQDLDNQLYLDLESGRVIIQMRPDLAPNHVRRIKELVRSGFYDGLTFHRVIEGFMAQGGDPLGTGTGGSGQKIRAEFSDEPHVEGTVSMARSQNPDSADSQFFIVFQPAPWLDGQYTVWGQVIEGMEFVHGIERGRGSGGHVRNPTSIVQMQIARDTLEEQSGDGDIFGDTDQKK